MTQVPAFDVALVPERARVRVVPSGELDIATRGVLQTQLDDLWASNWLHVVLDLRGLSFMAAAGVHLLIENQRSASRNGRQFSIIEGDEIVSRVVILTRRARPVLATECEAV